MISKNAEKKLRRVCDLEAQKGREPGFAEAIEAGFDEYLKHHDPVKKAERAQNRSKKEPSKKPLCALRVRLTAEQKHAVFLRDGGRCTHHDNGVRCTSERWIDVHHIILVSQGGSNDPENLTTLCSFHHDLIHQLPLEGLGA